MKPISFLPPLMALLLVGAADPAPVDRSAAAREIEALINEEYAYLDRLPGGRFQLTLKLQSEAGAVRRDRDLVQFTERALMLLADHHAITSNSLADSWALVPSHADLWIESRGGAYVIEAVREQSPAEQAGIKAGDLLVEVDGQPIDQLVKSFWADLGTVGGGERDSYAARILAAGRRDRPRYIGVSRSTNEVHQWKLASLYALERPPRSPVSVIAAGSEYRIRINNALGDEATIAAFDAAMAGVGGRQQLVIDLRDTPSGGNTTVARAILGWFVSRPTSYQVHRLPSEERRTGIARQWIEQVMPRPGKSYRRPVIVRVGRWTGSMGEGLGIGFDALGARVEGRQMAGLLGAVYDLPLPSSKLIIKLPAERLSTVQGTPRERFRPFAPRKPR